MVSLWKLPYWHKLKVSHNLDVIHIEKNICESLIATILNIARKTKDTIKVRHDMKDLGIKKELQFRETGDSCQMPHAIIVRLLKVREKEVHDSESEDENEEDDTLFQCCSEDEGGAPTVVGSDDE
jgi:hypothetical protein